MREGCQIRHVRRSVGDIFYIGRSLADESCFPRISKKLVFQDAGDYEFNNAKVKVFVS